MYVVYSQVRVQAGALLRNRWTQSIPDRRDPVKFNRLQMRGCCLGIDEKRWKGGRNVNGCRMWSRHWLIAVRTITQCQCRVNKRRSGVVVIGSLLVHPRDHALKCREALWNRTVWVMGEGERCALHQEHGEESQAESLFQLRLRGMRLWVSSCH